jgi:AcrR family transcriptional regulator
VTPAAPRTTGRDALLTRAIAHFAERGVGDTSLRGLADAIGTSHRMLIYHFGSREGLLARVVERMEAEQRALLADLETGDRSIFEISREFWERVTAPEMLPVQRLFFEIYVQALYGHDWTAAFRESVIQAWEGPLIALFSRAGVDASRARAHARLGLAVTRGLGLDLLMTGERDRVEEALELFATMVRADLPGGGAG